MLGDSAYTGRPRDRGRWFEARGRTDPHCIPLADPSSGLRGFIVLDDLTLGPAAGGIRVSSYASDSEALQDCLELARAMTWKCSLAGLDAGGGKAVIIDHDHWDRRAAFRELGRRIERLGGRFRTAGDLGTSEDDLNAAAEMTSFVQVNEGILARAAARGILQAARACLRFRGRESIAGLTVLIQGCGTIGTAAAAAFAEAGARLFLTDLDPARVRAAQRHAGGEGVAPGDAIVAGVDMIVPCGRGGVIDRAAAAQLKAWAVCGGANNIVTGEEAEQILLNRRILFVPDVISSAGAVIEGIGESVMNLADRTFLIDRIFDSSLEVLRASAEECEIPSRVAQRMALRRLLKRRAHRHSI